MSKPVSLPLIRDFDKHPTVMALRRAQAPERVPPSFEEIRAIALAAGADDVGLVALSHPDLAEERPRAERVLPGAVAIVSFVVRTHPESIRSPARSMANLEFHRAGHDVDEIAHAIARALSERGYPSVNPAMGFPMEMDDFPGRTWVISQKTVAVAAQLGRIGIHRSVIHPKFGSFILLGCVITTLPAVQAPVPLDFNPCVGCKLCVAACPVGAIESDGSFRFSACYEHNYREFMSGFGDLTETLAESRTRADLRQKVSISESASMWQSLAYGPNYKAAYCIAVCPAGEDVMRPYLEDRAAFKMQVLKPLTDKAEPVYVVAGSDAEAHVTKRFPNKTPRRVRSSLRALDVAGLFRSLPLVFQRRPAQGWKGVFHFELSGEQPLTATVRINDGTLEVESGLVGVADVHVRTSGKLWLEIVERRRNPIFLLLTGRLKIKGNPRLLGRFAACFPQ
ncbi:MAG: SCP2 sterol-binding domain-containing protein [Myxococcota bacterium]